MSSPSTPTPPPVLPPFEALRLIEADFEALARSLGNSPERVGLARRMTAWGEGVVLRLAEMDVQVTSEGRARTSGDAARMYFIRDRSLRSELRREGSGELEDREDVHPTHNREARGRTARGLKKTRRTDRSFGVLHESNAFLALTIARSFVEVSFEVPPDARADVLNLRARLADPVLAIELVTSLEALPEQFVIGLGLSNSPNSGDSERRAAHGVDAEQMRAILDRSVETSRPLFIGWRVPRDIALAHADVLGDQLEDALVALGEIYQVVAWSPENDWRGRDHVRREVRERERAREDERVAKKKPKSKSKHAKRSPRDARTAKITHSRRHEPAPESIDAEPPSIAHPSPLSPSQGFAPRHTARLSVSRSPFKTSALKAARTPRVTDIDPSIPIEKGARVRVLAGPFIGKVGIVQSVDGRGGARVMLGLLATRVDVKDLIGSAEGRDRPLLTSSHRKPLPAR